MAFFYAQKAANQHTERSQNAVNNSTHQRKTHEYTVLPLTSWSKVVPNLKFGTAFATIISSSDWYYTCCI